LPGSALGKDNAGIAAKGASPLGFCGVNFNPEKPVVADAAAGSENAVSVEPIIMAVSISNIG
jgi:hypothetical protein